MGFFLLVVVVVVVEDERGGGEEGGVRGEARVRSEVQIAPGGAARGACGGGGGGGGGWDEAELLGEHAAGAAPGCAGAVGGGGGGLADAEARRRLRWGVPELEGDHQGDRQDPRGVGQAHLSYLLEAGLPLDS